MQDIQIFGAGNASAPNSPMEIPVQENREDFFTAPPLPSQEALQKKSLLSSSPFFGWIIVVIFLFFISVGAYSFFFSNERFLEKINSSYTESPGNVILSIEIRDISVKQASLMMDIYASGSTGEKRQNLSELKDLEDQRVEKFKELYEKFPYENFSTAEQVKLKHYGLKPVGFIANEIRCSG